MLAACLAPPLSQGVGTPVDLQCCVQRSTAPTVGLDVFKARPSGKRIFLLKDDIFRDLIFKQ